jgi:hypothetical protein
MLDRTFFELCNALHVIRELSAPCRNRASQSSLTQPLTSHARLPHTRSALSARRSLAPQLAAYAPRHGFLPRAPLDAPSLSSGALRALASRLFTLLFTPRCSRLAPREPARSAPARRILIFIILYCFVLYYIIFILYCIVLYYI